MSATALAWVLMFLALSVMAMRRASWGAALYMLTFFALPDFWWWGEGTALAGQRWSLFSGLIFLVASLAHNVASRGPDEPLLDRSRTIAFLILLNCTVVHFLLAGNPAQSALVYSLVWKFVLLFWTLTICVHDRQDLYNVILALLIGAGYIGYEATINDRGHMVRGRLEGIGTPSANSANHLAALFVSVLPIVGGVFFLVDRRLKVLAALLLPLIVNVILLCNSRGAFLGCIVGGATLIIVSRGAARKRAVTGLGLGILAFFLLMNDPKIWERFMSTFAKEEERDESAASRLQYWQAGLMMCAERPYGSGGGGFKHAYGARYLGKVGIFEDEDRAVHNGYLNEVCEWGVQGLVLRLSFLLTVGLAVFRGMSWAERAGDSNFAFLGGCICAALAVFLATAMFGDVLDAEWGYWLAGIGFAYTRLALATVPQASVYYAPWAVVEGRRVQFGPVPTGA